MKASNTLVAAALAGVFAATTAAASTFIPGKDKEKDDCPDKDKEKKEELIISGDKEKDKDDCPDKDKDKDKDDCPGKDKDKEKKDEIL